MSLATLLIDPVVIQQPTTGTDRYGNQTSSYPSDGTGTAAMGRLQQTSGSEVTVDRDTQTSDWRLFLLPDVTITGDSRVLDTAGRIFEVVGPPAMFSGARAPHHQEINLRYVTG